MIKDAAYFLFDVFCISRCGVGNGQSVVSAKSDVDVEVLQLEKEETSSLARMFQHRRSYPLWRQMLYRPSFAEVAVCA